MTPPWHFVRQDGSHYLWKREHEEYFTLFGHQRLAIAAIWRCVFGALR